ncbi:MAG: glycerate kinase [Steroidobacteraceae bacterium]
MDPRALLMQAFECAIAAADPARILAPATLDLRGSRVRVLGAGKAAASMAAAVEAAWDDLTLLEGVVVTRDGHALPTARITVLTAAHPVPDERCVAAADWLLDLARGCPAGTLMLGLWSGGGSSLLSRPVEGVSLAQYQDLTRALLRGGVPIGEFNTLRRHLSASQGGRLALASPVAIRNLILSDVPGDDPSAIASGPCCPDPTSFADCLDILARWRIEAADSIRQHLLAGAAGRVEETPKPGHPRFATVDTRIIGSGARSLAAASRLLGEAGVRVIDLGDGITGEAREVARSHAARIRELARGRGPHEAPVALLSGGECTVSVRGPGRGGRCSEYLLQLWLELRELAGVHAIACDTDGIDGTEDNAGAWFGPGLADRVREAGLDAGECLRRNDAHGFFAAAGALVHTGPTRTNVNDFRCVMLL